MGVWRAPCSTVDGAFSPSTPATALHADLLDSTLFDSVTGTHTCGVDTMSWLMDGRLAPSALHSLVAAPAKSGEGLSAMPWVQRAGSCVVGAAVMGGARWAGRWMQGMQTLCADRHEVRL